MFFFLFLSSTLTLDRVVTSFSCFSLLFCWSAKELEMLMKWLESKAGGCGPRKKKDSLQHLDQVAHFGIHALITNLSN